MSGAPEIETPGEVWVIDTSSVLEIRREKIPRTARSRVTRGLTALVKTGALVFPPQVLGELRHGHAMLPEDAVDEPFDWALGVEAIASRHPVDFDAVRRALAKAPHVLDTEKTHGSDEADPYVLGLALTLKENSHEVTVVTEERKDRPDKMSLSTACGLLRLYAVPFLAFLEDRGIWTPE
jgi:hypothetical protein